MKTLGFNSLIVFILASALQTRAEQSVNEDDTLRAATPVDIAAPNLAENYFVNCANYGSAQDFSLATNIAFVDTNIYAASTGIYTLEPTDLGSRQALVDSIPFVGLAAKPSGTTLGEVGSRNKSDYVFSLTEVEFWPFMQGQIQNDIEYYLRIATSGPIDQFETERLVDGGPGYSSVEFLLSLAATFVAHPMWSTPWWLALGSTALFAIMIIYSVLLPVPINNQVARWQPDSLPANWRQLRRRWDGLHAIRVVFLAVALILLVSSSVI